LGELDERGFVTRWIEVAAKHVGCPQTRRRWFALAIRGSPFSEEGFADIIPEGLRLAAGQTMNLNFYDGISGANFNPPGRPPPERWHSDGDMHRDAVEARLRMLGNAVVPLQAFLAARALSTLIGGESAFPRLPDP
jgi:hypothetical protein